MSNPDPKPGRWILPLIIIGMVGFTYYFVSSLPAPTPEGTTTTKATSTSTTTSTGSSVGTTTTSTTLPEEIQSYLDDMAQQKADLDTLSTDLLAANAAWNDKTNTGASYTDTKAAFQEAIDRATVLDESLQTLTPPAGNADLASFHEDLSTAAGKVLDTTKSALAGLQSSDTGAARDAAIAAFNDAVAEFTSVYDGMVAAMSGATGTGDTTSTTSGG